MMLLGALSALLIAALVAAVVFAWLLGGGALRHSRRPPRHGPDAEAAFRRHPAGRSRRAGPYDQLAIGQADTSPDLGKPAGPDDDPDFISELERLIRGDGEDDRF